MTVAAIMGIASPFSAGGLIELRWLGRRSRASHRRVWASVRSWDAITLAGMLALLDADRLAALVDRRHAWGVDVFDEVWEGVRHHPPVGPHSTLQQVIALALRNRAQQRGLTPVLGAFEPRDPDAGHGHRDAERLLRGDMAAGAALAVEIAPAPDWTEPRLARLAADRVKEVLVVDLRRRVVTWLVLLDGRLPPRRAERSAGPRRRGARAAGQPAGARRAVTA
jgi:hypothetical protein